MKWATDYLRKIELQFNGRLDDFTFHKIVNSYAIYNPMMCDAFSLLHGRLTNRQEKERMLHYFICSSLFDNFCDRDALTVKQLNDISFNTELYHAERFDEKLFLHSHVLLRDYVRDKQYYNEVTHKLFDVQQRSAKQFDEGITDEELEAITFMKGGYSVLLCHFYMDEEATAEEQQCWYRIGSIIQLTNDLYDIYKDIQDGSQTLANRMRNAYAFNEFFLGIVGNMKKEIEALPCPASVKRSFAVSMMGICAFGLIALQQLQQVQGTAFELPDFQTLPRKSLIIDMEKLSNLWKWMRLVYHHSKEIS